MTNPYVRYYLDQQQQGYGMSVFRGSPWQMGHGQMGFGLGGLFRSVARAIMPMLRSGAKDLGKIALHTGTNMIGDIASGRSMEETVKCRGKEALGAAKDKAVTRLVNYVQKGSGSKRQRKPLAAKKTNKKRKASRSAVRKSQTKKPRTAKKRKATATATRTSQTKKRRTAPDIFG